MEPVNRRSYEIAIGTLELYHSAGPDEGLLYSSIIKEYVEYLEESIKTLEATIEKMEKEKQNVQPNDIPGDLN